MSYTAAAILAGEIATPGLAGEEPTGLSGVAGMAGGGAGGVGSGSPGLTPRAPGSFPSRGAAEIGRSAWRHVGGRGANREADEVNALDDAAGGVDALARIFHERVLVREEEARAAKARARAVARQEAEQRRVREEAEAETRAQAAAAAERAARAEAVRVAVELAEGLRAGAAADEAAAACAAAEREGEAFAEEATGLLAIDSGADRNDAHGAVGLRARVAAARRRLSAQVLPGATQAVTQAQSLVGQLQAALRPLALGHLLAPPDGGWGSPALLKAVGPIGAEDASRAGVLSAEANQLRMAVAGAATLLDRTREAFQRLCEDLDEVAPPAGIPDGPPGDAELELRPLTGEEQRQVDAALAGGGNPSEVLAEYDNVPVRNS